MGWLGWVRSKHWIRNPARFVKFRLLGHARRLGRREARPINLEQLARLPQRIHVGPWEVAFTTRWPIRTKIQRTRPASGDAVASHLNPKWTRESQPFSNQRTDDRKEAEVLAFRPLVSIVLPITPSSAHLLARTLLSVQRQSYSNWELCLIDDGLPQATKSFWEAAKRDSRIRVFHRGEAGGISATTNDGIRMAQGDFVAFLEPKDQLAAGALFEIVKRLNEVPEADLLYSDHDQIDEFENRLDPNWKPDWSPDYFRTDMYLGDLMVVRRELLTRVGGCDPRFDGIQKFELALRISENTRRIEHLAMVLYHRRTPKISGLAEMQAQAVQEHLDRLRLPMIAEATESQSVRLHPKPRRVYPRVSVLTPDCGPTELLNQSIHALTALTTYPNLEIFARGPVPQGWSRHPVHEIQFGEAISRSEAVNRMARLTKSRFVLILAAGAKPLTPDWIERLLVYADQTEIGAVGPRSDGNPSDVVSADCFLIAKSHFEAIGGLNEHLESREAGVDLCRRLAARGLLSLRVGGAKIVLPTP